MEHSQRKRIPNLPWRNRSKRVTVTEMLFELLVFNNLKTQDLRNLRLRDLTPSDGTLRIWTRDEKGRFKGAIFVQESLAKPLQRFIWRYRWKEGVKDCLQAGLDSSRSAFNSVMARTERLVVAGSKREMEPLGRPRFKRRKRKSLIEKRPCLRARVAIGRSFGGRANG